MDGDLTLTFEALRREFGVTSRTLRYYEELGLLGPEKSGQRRRYRQRDRARLRLILACRNAGLSLSEARRVLAAGALSDDAAGEPGGDPAVLRAQVAALRRRRAELDALIADLKRLCGEPTPRSPGVAEKA